jgi:hypothetical protein
MADDSKPVWSPVFLRGATSAQGRIRRGEHHGAAGDAGPSVAAMIDDFLEAVDDGLAHDRHGRPFAPETVRELHWSLAGYFREELGTRRLSDLRRHDIEALIYALGDGGVPPRRLRALAKSVRALYDHGAERGVVGHNPAERLAIPDGDDDHEPAASTDPGILDRAIALTLRLATLGLLLIALILLAESL